MDGPEGAAGKPFAFLVSPEPSPHTLPTTEDLGFFPLTLCAHPNTDTTPKIETFKRRRKLGEYSRLVCWRRVLGV